jgi:hypothetical protein
VPVPPPPSPGPATAEELADIQRLAARFEEVGLSGWLGALRMYYAARREGEGSHAFDARQVRYWMETLQMPPYAHALPVVPRGSACPSCDEPHPHPDPVPFYRGLRRRDCLACGAGWLIAGR